MAPAGWKGFPPEPQGLAPQAGVPAPGEAGAARGAPHSSPLARGNLQGHGTAPRHRGESAELPEQGRRPAGIFLAKLEVKQRWELSGIQEAPASPATSVWPRSWWLRLELPPLPVLSFPGVLRE